MSVTVARGARAWLGRRAAALLFILTAAGLVAGGAAWLAGEHAVADGCWLAAACGLGLRLLWSAADSLGGGGSAWT